MKRNKLYRVALIFILFLTLVSCKKELVNKPDTPTNQTEATAEKSTSNSYSSKDADILHEKYFVEHSGWIYYHNRDDKDRLYKISIDGHKNIKVSDNYLGAYCLDGDWIYFSNFSDKGRLYRIKTDGSAMEKLSDDESCSINISKEWVYYRNVTDNDCIYKIKKDGKNRTKLGADPVSNIYVGEGDWVYYTNSSEDNCIYMIGMDGRERTKISGASTYTLCTSEGWIYYALSDTNEINYPRIFKIRRDGSDETCLANGEPYEVISELEVFEEYIYYNTFNSKEALYRLKKDGTEHEKLTFEGEHISLFDVSKSGLFFSSTLYNYNIYKMDLKNKKEIIIDERVPLDKEHLAEWIIYNDKEGSIGLNISKKENEYDVLNRPAHNIKIINNTAYFLAEREDKKNNLYKLEADSTGPKIVLEGNITAYDIAEEHVYYYDSDDHTIYSIKTDGTDKQQVSKNEADYIYVKDEWIYYNLMLNTSCKVRLNGTGSQQLTFGSILSILDDWVYYVDKMGGLYRSKLDGSEKKLLFKDAYGIGSKLAIIDGRLYYDLLFAEGGGHYNWVKGLYSIKLDGTDKQTLLEATFESWGIYEDFAYYSKIDRDMNIIKAKHDGTERSVIIADIKWQ